MVNTWCGVVGLALARALSGYARERRNSQPATHLFFRLGTTFLVGVDLRATGCAGLRRGGAVRLFHGDAQRLAGRVADLCFKNLVPGIPGISSGMGTFAY